MFITHSQFSNLYIKNQNIFNFIFDGVTNFSTLIKSIEKVSSDYSKYSYIDSDKMKGDLFEIFAELFIKILGNNGQIGIGDYSPNQVDDFGVDGHGLGINGQPVTIQVKYRNNPTYELLQEDIKQFPFQSIRLFNVDPFSDGDMIVFTSAKGLHWSTDKNVFCGAVRTIGFDFISTQVNNNIPFWNQIKNIINLTIDENF
jgi:hypothetical protein